MLTMYQWNLLGMCKNVQSHTTELPKLTSDDAKKVGGSSTEICGNFGYSVEPPARFASGRLAYHETRLKIKVRRDAVGIASKRGINKTLNIDLCYTFTE